MKNKDDDKKMTIDYLKEKMKVPDELQDMLKEYNKLKRTILKTIKTEAKTIPQIAEEANLSQDLTTYHVMTLLKYGQIEAGDIDDMDEYYYYKAKGKGK